MSSASWFARSVAALSFACTASIPEGCVAAFVFPGSVPVPPALSLLPQTTEGEPLTETPGAISVKPPPEPPEPPEPPSEGGFFAGGTAGGL